MHPQVCCPASWVGQVLLQPTACPQHSEVPSAQVSFSSHGWSRSQSTPPGCKMLASLSPLSAQIFACFLRVLSFFFLSFFFKYFPFNIWIFLSEVYICFKFRCPCRDRWTNNTQSQARANFLPLPVRGQWGSHSNEEDFRSSICGMWSGGPFGRQEYTLKHSVVEPVIIIIVSLLTRVHQLSVNLLLSSCFFGARAKC